MATTEAGGARQPEITRSVLSLPKEVLQPDTRRQNKIIAGMVRKNPALLREPDASVSPEERDTYLKKVVVGTINNEQYKDVLARAFPLPSAQEPDPQNPTEVFKNFSGEEREQRQLRRVISLITRGTVDQHARVKPSDIYHLVQKLPTAVDLEQQIPEIIDQIRNSLGEEQVGEYLLAINRVADIVYAPQWQYLKQMRLLEKQVPNIPEAVLLREELERERAARKALEERYMAQQDQLHGILPAYDELRGQQDKTLRTLADKELEVIQLKAETEADTVRLITVVDELAVANRRSSGLRDQLDTRNSELGKANESVRTLNQENNTLSRKLGEQSRTEAELRQRLLGQTGASHTDREYAQLLRIADQLTAGVEKSKRGAGGQAPVDSFLGAIGYTRQKLHELRRIANPEEQRKTVERIRGMGARLWHEGGLTPNPDAMKEFNSLMDQFDPRANGSK